MSIKRFLRKVAHANRTEALLLQANAAIAQYMDDTYLQLWEEELERKILIVGMPEFAWSKYRIELQGTCDAVERRARQMERRESSLVVHRASAS